MIRLLCCLLSSIFLVSLSAQSTALTSARAALTDVDQDVRIAALDSLRATGSVSPALYLALGNAHYEDDRPGLAVLAYERGLRLAPGHDDLANNLRFVREDAGIEELRVRPFFVISWWRSVGALLGVGLSQWLALLLWVLAVAGATYWFLRHREMDEKQRFALLPAAVVCFLFAGLFYTLGDSRAAFLHNDREAILTARTASLRVAPGPAATLETELTEGTRIRILAEFDGYVKVALENGKQGYLPEESLERI